MRLCIGGLCLAILVSCLAPVIGEDEGTLLGDKGLVLHFPFDEGAGAKAQDASGQGINGEIVGSPAWVDGVKGKALLLDGKTFIRLPDGDVFGIKDEITLCFWARNDDQPWSRWAGIFSICDQSGYGYRLAQVRWGYDESYLQVLRRNGQTAKMDGHYLRVGLSYSLHFYAVVFQGAEVTVFKDGEKTDSRKFKLDLMDLDKSDTYNLVGNTWIRGSGRAFKGILDEFRVYNRALTSEEIKEQFRSYGFTDYPNLVANSSFEITTLPDWPDRWMSKAGYHVHRKDYDLVVDRTVSRTGQNSLCFDIKEAMAGHAPYNARFFFFFPPLEPGDYMLSAYLKADRPGMRFTMGMSDTKSDNFTSTNTWERYQVPFRCEKRARGCVYFLPLKNEKGKIWLDDVMVCRGHKLTPYQPAIKDTYKPRGGMTDAIGGGPPVAVGEMKSAVTASGGPPEIDGRLTDGCWTNALETTRFVPLKGREPVKAGKGSLCYDDRALYVGFRLEDPDIAGKTLRAYEHDSLELWKDEVVEVFVDTDPGDEVYHHFVLSLGGAQWDAKVIFQKDTIGAAKFLRHGANSWNGEWRGATRKTEGGWEAELELPWNLFSQYLGDPAEFRVNLNRTAAGEKPEYTGWSTTPDGFNCPWRFAHVKGLEVDWDRWRVWVEQARLVPLMEKGLYRLVTEGRNGSRSSRQFDVWVRSAEFDLKRAGTFDVAPGGAFNAHMDLDGLSEGRSMWCEVLPREGDAVLAFHRFDLEAEEAVHLSTPSKVVRGKTLNAVFQCRYPAELIKGAELECRIDPGVESKTFPAHVGVNELRLPTKDLASGEAWLEAVLKVGGKTHRSEKSGFEVLPDGENLVVMDPVKGMVIAGEPFLPIAVCLHGMREHHLPDLKAHGVNALLWFLRPPEQDADPKDLLGWLDQIHEHGFRVIMDFGYIARKMKFPDLSTVEKRAAERIRLMKKIAEGVKSHPAIVAWHTMDEPRAHNPEMGDLKYMTMMYETIREVDPNRPIFYNMGTTGLRTKHAPVEASDTVMYDYYEYPVGPDRRPFEKAQEYLRFGKQWAMNTGRPLYTFIALNGGAYPSYVRMHRPVELKCRMYLDLVEGSRGLFFYSGPPCSKILWAAFGEYAHQITGISSALFNPSPRVSVEADFVRLRTYTGEMDDAVVIVAVNPVHETRDVALRITMDGKLPAKAEVLFEDRSVGLSQNRLVDAFASYEVHVYRIAL